jgi:hypothetical protein
LLLVVVVILFAASASFCLVAIYKALNLAVVARDFTDGPDRNPG